MIETSYVGSVVIGWKLTMSEPQHSDIDGSDYSKLLAGHLGHLTPSQEKSLETFKQNLQKANLYNPTSDNRGSPSHDDTTLLYLFDSPTLSGFVDALTNTGDSSVPGDSISSRHRSSLPTTLPGGRSTT
jgi:hypothetical protein